jgi:hypothetical protein
MGGGGHNIPVSVAGCLGYDVLVTKCWGKGHCLLFQLLVV